MLTRNPFNKEALAELRTAWQEARKGVPHPLPSEAELLLALAKRHSAVIDEMAAEAHVSRATMYRRIRTAGLTKQVRNMRETYRMFARADAVIERMYAATHERYEAVYHQMVISAWLLRI